MWYHRSIFEKLNPGIFKRILQSLPPCRPNCAIAFLCSDYCIRGYLGITESGQLN